MTYGEDQEEGWRRIASMELPSPRVVEIEGENNEEADEKALDLTQTAVAEVMMESLDTAVCITKALHIAMIYSREMGEECIKELENITKSRFAYEHSMLKKWTSDLRTAYQHPPNRNQDLLMNIRC
eukprot:CAMPEP_0182438588 /NCGR_PEP_ID=MMETSP1167-20130531/85878_1 /TAXON_ID=2988 /ORGANISM="Mallomonas Sp, Strain CCMP3275" /LENGTH=125 /DNA_ID=CAMNT_0024632019 /DNA_START=61 /DNA_END=438 /DNA_ORIENTATION=-